MSRSGGRYPYPHPKTGFWYGPSAPGACLTSAQSTTGNEFAQPFFTAGGTYDRIATVQVANPTASELMRFGVRNDNGFGYPGALITDFGTVDLSTGGLKTITIALTLGPGLYWVTSTRQGPTNTGTTTAYAYIPAGGTVALSEFTPASTAATPTFNNEAPIGFFQTGVTAALPASFSATINAGGTNASTQPAAFLRST